LSVLQAAGPSMIVGYAIGGFIAFLTMRQLGEMVAQEPVAGSFSHFAYKYWGDFPGFLSGWNYWVLYVLVSMAELTAVGHYVHFWWPQCRRGCPRSCALSRSMRSISRT
jgi:aromatic amino acid transport protein AroP